MIRFTGSVEGKTQFDRSFNRIKDYISDFRSIWPSVIQEFYQIEREQFISEGSKGASGKWAKLKPSYSVWKEKHFPDKPILQLTGHLFASMTDPGAADAVLIPAAMSLTIGTKDPVAVYHQRGHSKGYFPAREVISLSEDGKLRLQKAIQRPLVAFARGQGFITGAQEAANSAIRAASVI